MKNWLIALCLIAAISLGWLARLGFDASHKPTIEQRSLVIEQQIKKIVQLSTAEGHYNHMFNHKEVGFFDYPAFNKSLIIDATARVVVGFNLEGIELVVDHDNKRIRILNWPKPQELGFELDVRYFDLEQGWFNSFASKDLNTIKEKVRTELKEKVDYTKLEQESYEQAKDILSILSQDLSLSGWELQVVNRPEMVLKS